MILLGDNDLNVNNNSTTQDLVTQLIWYRPAILLFSERSSKNREYSEDVYPFVRAFAVRDMTPAQYILYRRAVVSATAIVLTLSY